MAKSMDDHRAATSRQDVLDLRAVYAVHLEVTDAEVVAAFCGCSDSPVGHCFYNNQEDLAHHRCLFCGGRERAIPVRE